MIREFRIFVEIPDNLGNTFHEELEYWCDETYPDEIDIAYFRQLATDLYPDATFIQIFELAEEIKLKKEKR